MKTLILFTLKFLIISTLAQASTKYPFYLDIISEDKNLETLIRDKAKKITPKFSNLKLREDKDGRVFVKLFIYALRHKNSNVANDTIILSATHVNKRRIFELTNEVFKKDSKSSEFTKTIAADLMLRDSSLMRHINVAATDDIDRIGVPIARFLKDLSKNIQGYYESSFFDMFKHK